MRWALGRVRAKREFKEGGRKGGFAPATGHKCKEGDFKLGLVKVRNEGSDFKRELRNVFRLFRNVLS